jgi:hypothetical protein
MALSKGFRNNQPGRVLLVCVFLFLLGCKSTQVIEYESVNAIPGFSENLENEIFQMEKEWVNVQKPLKIEAVVSQLKTRPVIKLKVVDLPPKPLKEVGLPKAQQKAKWIKPIKIKEEKLTPVKSKKPRTEGPEKDFKNAESWSITAFFMAMVGLITVVGIPFLLPLAMIPALIALKRYKKYPGQKRKGFAVFALVLSIVATAVIAGLFLMSFFNLLFL